MNDAMPRPRPPHLIREVSRHGRVTWVVRIGHGPRTRLRAAYGTPGFEAEYHAAIRGEPASGPRRAGAGTLQWLWDRYRQSSAWSALANATRRQRENIMLHVLSAPIHRQRCFSEILVRGDFGCGSSFGFFPA
jgi:hypothetical protein